MTTQIEIEWVVENLRATADYFISSGSADRAVGTSVPLTTVHAAENFLLGRVEAKIRELNIPADLSRIFHDAFVAYKPVWISILLSKNTTYDIDDRLIGGAAGALREHNALSRKDAGIVDSRTIDLATVETASLLVQVTFLVKL